MNRDNVLISQSNPRVKELARILKDQKRASEKYFLVEGEHLVELAKKNCALIEVYSLKPYSFEKVTIVNDGILSKISSTVTPQGIVGLCVKPNNILSNINSNVVFYLDGIQDPGNVGTILRTLLAFGFLNVILSPTCASLYNSKTLLGSQGAIFNMNVNVLSEMSLVEFAKNNGYAIITTELDEKASSINSFQLDGKKYIFVLGSEGSGVSLIIRKQKKQALYIPITNIESINVGVAAGILAYHLANLK